MRGRKLLSVHVLTVLILLLSLFFTSSAFGEGSNGSGISDVIVQQGKEVLKKERQKAAGDLKEKLGLGGTDNGKSKVYKPNEKVRIIVEIEQPKKLKKMNQKTKKQQMKKAQDQVIQSIQKAKSKSELRHRFFEGMNGFSMETKYKHLKQIEDLSHVEGVHIAKTFQPALNASKGLVQAQETWEKYGLKGEGLLVAVVDSGLDYTHEDMKLSKKGKEEEKWTKSSIQSILDET